LNTSLSFKNDNPINYEFVALQISGCSEKNTFRKFFHFNNEIFHTFMQSIMIMPVNKTDQEIKVKDKFRSLKIGNRNEVFMAATKGVKASVFYDLAELSGMSDRELAATINLSARTVSNYLDARKSFEPLYGEHLLKLVGLYMKGEEIFGNVSEFNYWLNKPLWKSGNKPRHWLITPGGVDLAMDEIEKIAQGYPI
jgi:uncharacterized protein (DUF2384 family)